SPRISARIVEETPERITVRSLVSRFCVSLYLWTGFGNLSWNSQTWLGNGLFYGIDGGSETQNLDTSDLTVILSGVSSTILAEILGDQKQNAAGSVYIGFLDASGAVIADPYLDWSGKFSHAEIVESGDKST